ncbi:DUF4241 domain-containing protein [Bacillus sp. FJAT-52991]|uniref:DUF4241 domain-containing protein n=1 Tax=Bacillus kandeliae TaxID=3129297 RepID=A0ABZ2N4I5_9BACI
MSKVLRELSKIGEKTLRPEVLEPLKIVSGKIVACEPGVFDNRSFERLIEPGSYPVVAWWHEDTQLIAAAELKLSDGVPVRWEMATKPGQNIDELEEGHIFGYPVDTGLGCFADQEAIGKMSEIEARLVRELGEDFISFYDDALDDVLMEHDDVWGNFIVSKENGLNAILFRTGYGDGFYASYWGMDEDGQIVSLVTDFNVL